ncbi:MAG: hypothetical protein LBO09_06305 [Candidatus Peribacteria bacterium]|jgi:hypothetical protein|nr:hypothetical protein [Candidatus Peribacteria bacterium]
MGLGVPSPHKNPPIALNIPKKIPEIQIPTTIPINVFPKKPPKLTSFGALSSNLSAFLLRGTGASCLIGLPHPIGGIEVKSRGVVASIEKEIENKGITYTVRF